MSEQLGQAAAAAAIQAGDQAQQTQQPAPAPVVPEASAPAPVQQPSTAEVPDKTSADAPAGDAPADAGAKPEGVEPLAKTGDDVLDAGIEMMQQVAGLSPADVERIFAKANASGDSADIDKDFIKERFKEHASYIEKLADRYVQYSNKQANDVVTGIHDKVGGAERWNLLNETFKQNAPAHLQTAVKALADANDFTNAADIIVGFSESSGLVPVQNGLLKGGAASDSALSAKEFSAEYAKLREAAGGRSLESGKFAESYQSLVRRRALGKSKGL